MDEAIVRGRNLAVASLSFSRCAPCPPPPVLRALCVKNLCVSPSLCLCVTPPPLFSKTSLCLSVTLFESSFPSVPRNEPPHELATLVREDPEIPGTQQAEAYVT